MRKSLPLHVILIAILGLLAYSNTFNAPFQWDEKYLIVENPIVKDTGYFLKPFEAKRFGEYYGAFKTRYIGYLSFALNYKLHSLDVRGYHIFNITVHVLNALLVYLLVILTFRTPFLSRSSLKEHSGYIALFSGLLFLLHPVQTEAVTYIFQRLASLAAFFYLLSLTAYIGSRLSTGTPRRYALYALSLISAVLAMKTKENAFTLPLVITLYELFFFKGLLKHRALRLTPLLLTLLIIPLALAGTDRPAGEIIGGIGAAARGCEDISQMEYFFTEFRVVVTYIRLLFMPVNQNIDYDYPVLQSFFNLQVFPSFLFLLAVFGLGVYLFYRSRHTAPELRLAAFGVFWFFITLSVESSIIPIPMLINEYRVYLPSAGVVPAAVTGAFLLPGKLRHGKTRAGMVLFAVLILLVFLYATYARNSLWRSETTLWQDAVRKSPHKARTHYNLALAYGNEGLTDKAIEQYRIALSLRPDFKEAHNNLGKAYNAKGLVDKAIEHFQAALRPGPDVNLYYNLGIAYMTKGLTDKAIEHYRAALRLRPDFPEAHNNLGNAYRARGLTDKAIEQYRTALRLRPDFPEAHNNLGNAYRAKGLIDKAIEHYRTALRLRPGFAEAHNNLGSAYRTRGLMDKAIEHYRTALRLRPDFLEARINLGIALQAERKRNSKKGL